MKYYLTVNSSGSLVAAEKAAYAYIRDTYHNGLTDDQGLGKIADALKAHADAFHTLHPRTKKFDVSLSIHMSPMPSFIHYGCVCIACTPIEHDLTE